MDINSLVSVIMPAYNSEKFIESSIKSVLEQTYTNLELIVIDDGSADKTAEIVNKFCEKDSRVILLKNKVNLGVSETRNRGIAFAKGDWIAFLDSDDIWEKLKIEKQLKYAREVNAEFIFTGCSYINEFGTPFSGIFEVPNQVSYKELLKQNVITCSSVLIKKKFFNNIRMENDEMHEDYAVWLKVLRTGVSAFGLNEPLLIYRISRNSKSGNKLKTIRMSYYVYRFIGLSPAVSAYFTFRHIMASVKKYRKINLKFL